MTGRVAVVTDSTAYLDPEVVDDLGVEVVPLQVVLDGAAYAEGTGVGPREVAEALRRHIPVSTSRPSPRLFLDVYESVAALGAEAAVSVHLSGSLSGTVDAARLAAADAPIPVSVVDSRSLGMGLGFAVRSAAEAAARGLMADEVAAVAADRAARSTAYFYVDTLDYLRRGGRIGMTSAMVGTALAMKALLHLEDGWIAPLEKVRTSGRAVARLEDLAVAMAEGVGANGGRDGGRAESRRTDSRRVDLAVHHLDNAVRAEALAERLAERLPAVGEIVITEVGAVVGAHVGPGLLGVVVSPR